MDKNTENNESIVAVPKGSVVEVSRKNDDGTISKVMEFESLSFGQKHEVSLLKDSVTLPLSYRIQTFEARTVVLHSPLKLSRETIRQIADELGLFDSE